MLEKLEGGVGEGRAEISGVHWVLQSWQSCLESFLLTWLHATAQDPFCYSRKLTETTHSPHPPPSTRSPPPHTLSHSGSDQLSCWAPVLPVSRSEGRTAVLSTGIAPVAMKSHHCSKHQTFFVTVCRCRSLELSSCLPLVLCPEEEKMNTLLTLWFRKISQKWKTTFTK